MKVYVDEIPLYCKTCKFYNSNSYCVETCGALTNEDDERVDVEDYSYCGFGETPERHPECPLQALADHDKEVRKQVCDEIRCKLMEDDYSELRDYQGIKYAWFNLPAFSEVLDQIEKGGENGTRN